LKSFNEEKFFEGCRFLHAHRIGRTLPSTVATQLREEYLPIYKSIVLVGVSGCGKSHAIYLNALDRICIYLTPNSWILRHFYEQCERIRPDFDFSLEDNYRYVILNLFYNYICARFVVLLYLKQELALSNEYLFFLQSVNALDVSDLLIYQLLVRNYTVMNAPLFGCFLAIDEAQKYVTPQYHILFRTGVFSAERISFARFFSWCSPILGAKVVISGTALRLRHMDRVNRQLEEYGIKILHGFDYFDCTRVKDIVLELVGSDVEEDLLNRMGFLLQGRPRILMNFIESIKRTGVSPESYLEEYIRRTIESRDSEVWSFYGLWKDLFEAPKRSLKVNLKLRDSDVGVECDIQTCFLKILMDSIRLLGDEDEDDVKMEKGSWFYLRSSEFDSISAGLCPLISLEESKYRFLEPLSLMSALLYIVSSPLLRSQCFVHLLEAMFDKGTTEHVRGCYFNLFVAMKVAADSVFRRRLFDMAVEIGRLDDRTKWISEMILPEKDYFKLKCKVSDEAFVRSLEVDDEDVILPSNRAGPDVKWWIFVFGLKTTWTNPLLSVDESSENEEAITPSLCFDWRDKREEEKPLKKKRKLLNQKCAQIADSRIKESRGFIRVRIELPSSRFESNINHESTNDIHLEIDWERFRALLSEDEAKRFEVYFK